VKQPSQIAATRRIALIALAVATVAVALLGVATASTAATDTNVSIVFRAYQPPQLTVLAGQTVTWRNSGLGPHTVTADAGQFSSGALQTGTTFSYTFSTPGTYAYSCTIHPTMHGRVVVLAALPPGFPPAASLDDVLVHLSKKPGAHGSTTLVHALAARPGAKALLQVQSPKGGWTTTRRTQLSPLGQVTFSLSASVRRRLRVVVRGAAGEAPLISKTVRTAA
jgi:plastocyanin